MGQDEEAWDRMRRHGTEQHMGEGMGVGMGVGMGEGCPWRPVILDGARTRL